MKKIIAKVLAAAAVVSAIAACPVMARYDAVCTHPNLKTSVSTLVVNNGPDHTTIVYDNEWCNDCGYEHSTELSRDTADHSYSETGYDYVQLEDGSWRKVIIYTCSCGSTQLT